MFTKHIISSRIPKYLEMPQMLEIYDGTRDPNKHIKHVDTVLDCHKAISAVECKKKCINP